MPIMERKLTAAKSVERANMGQDPPKESTNGTSMTSFSHP
jgi:hypothetical protein